MAQGSFPPYVFTSQAIPGYWIFAALYLVLAAVAWIPFWGYGTRSTARPLPVWERLLFLMLLGSAASPVVFACDPKPSVFSDPAAYQQASATFHRLDPWAYAIIAAEALLILLLPLRLKTAGPRMKG